MPHYPIPIPADIIEAVDREETPAYGAHIIAQRVKNRAEIRELWGPINAIYDSGTPFFTKDAIRDLLGQIDESGVRPVQTEPLSLRFSITGIDGKTVEIPLELGVRRGPWIWDDFDLGDGVELITASLNIDFRPADHLTSIAARPADEFEPERAFLSMVIEAVTIPVRSVTGEPVFLYPINTAAETRAILQRQKVKWDASEACQHLVATFGKLAHTESLPRVDKVVAFACGNPSDVERAEESAREHAMVLSLRDFFVCREKQQEEDQTTETGVRCYMQDPVYRDVDREVLRELGVTVLDHPRGFLEVDDSTVVVSGSPEAPIRQIVCDIARPAVMIWNKVCERPREGYGVGRVER